MSIQWCFFCRGSAYVLWADCWLECSAAGCVLVFMEFSLPPCLSYHPWWDAHVGTNASMHMRQVSSMFCLPLCFLPASGVNSSLLDLVPLQYYGTHPRTQGHTLLHPNHIFLPYQIHFHDSLEQWLSTGGLWTKNGSQVCSGLTVHSRAKMLSANTNLDILCDTLNLEYHEKDDACTI